MKFKRAHLPQTDDEYTVRMSSACVSVSIYDEEFVLFCCCCCSVTNENQPSKQRETNNNINTDQRIKQQQHHQHQQRSFVFSFARALSFPLFLFSFKLALFRYFVLLDLANFRLKSGYYTVLSNSNVSF